MKLGELFVSLGFDVDDAKLKGFRDGIGNLTKDFFKLTATATAGIYAINRALNSSVQSSLGLKGYRDYTGQATEDLERFANVARMANNSLTMENAIAAFKEVSNVLDEIKRKGEYPEGALWMGLGNLSDITNPADLVAKIYGDMPNIMKRLGGSRTAFSKELATIGLGGFESIFFLSPEKFREFWSMAIPTREQRAAMEDISRAYAKFGIEIQNIQMKLGASFAPKWISFIEGSTQAIKAFAGVAEYLGDVADRLQKKLGNLFNWLAGGAIAGAIALLSPMVLIVTGLASAFLGLVYAIDKLVQKIPSLESVNKSLDSGILKLLGLFNSNENSDFGMIKRDLADKIYGVGVKSDAELNIKPVPSSVSLQVSPTYNIQTDQDYMEFADAMDQYNQSLLDQGLAGIGIRASGARIGD